MPILKLREKEIIVTKDESQQIGIALLEGVGFFKIGNEVINSKYVIGIFESNESEPQLERLLTMPKPEKRDLKRIEQILLEMRKELEKKGILPK